MPVFQKRIRWTTELIQQWKLLGMSLSTLLFFFFQAEDGIRDYRVTGVQTCALPISFRGGQNPPRARVVSQVRGPLNRYGRNRLTVSGNNSKLQGLKVLVIDDSKTIRRTAETLLAKEGCEVFTAVDGFEGLSKSRDHQPHIGVVGIMY